MNLRSHIWPLLQLWWEEGYEICHLGDLSLMEDICGLKVQRLKANIYITEWKRVIVVTQKAIQSWRAKILVSHEEDDKMFNLPTSQ